LILNSSIFDNMAKNGYGARSVIPDI